MVHQLLLSHFTSIELLKNKLTYAVKLLKFASNQSKSFLEVEFFGLEIAPAESVCSGCVGSLRLVIIDTI